MSAVAAHVMFNSLLTTAGAHAIPSLATPKDAVHRKLTEIGITEIREQMSLGRLPNEVALHYGVPIQHFRSWLALAFTENEMADIKAAAAESLQIKAVLTLSAQLKNPAEASQAKALSERFAKQAEALAPKHWSPSHIDGAATRPMISISIQGTGQTQNVVDIKTTRMIGGDTSDTAERGGIDDFALGENESSLPPIDPYNDVDIPRRSAWSDDE